MRFFAMQAEDFEIRAEQCVQEHVDAVAEVERLLQTVSPESMDAQLRRSLFEELSLVRARLGAVLGDLSGQALAGAEQMDTMEQQHLAFTLLDREFVRLFQPTLTLCSRLMKGQEVREDRRAWGARRYAIQFEHLSKAVDALFGTVSRLEYPRVRDMLLHSLMHSRERLVHVLESEGKTGHERYVSTRPLATYDQLFERGAVVIRSLEPQKPSQVGGRGFRNHDRSLRECESRSGHVRPARLRRS